MTTFSEFRDTVSVALRDPSKVTFSDDVLKLMANAALAEIGRAAPSRFTESITLVDGTSTYQILESDFAGVAIPEIEVIRVELWDGSTSPHTPVGLIQPADQGYVNYSQTGWKVWDGMLEVPYWVPALASSGYYMRVWGYAPYPAMSADADVLPVSFEREQAMITYCRLEAVRRLLSDRELFTQWQAGAQNTDVSPAALMNIMSVISDEWRRTKRELMVLREGPG